MGEGGRLQKMCQQNLSETLLDPQSEETAQHLRLLQAVMASGEPRLVPPLASGQDPAQGANPTRLLLVLGMLKSDGAIEGVVEIFQRPDSQPVTQRGYLRFLVQMCEVVGEWLKGRKLKQFSDRHSLWAQADHFSRLVHEGLDARETAYTIANEGRRLIGCDRVAVAFKKGKKCIVESISGQDTLDNRSNIVSALNKLATRVVATGEPLWYEGITDDLPPQIEEAVSDYVEESYAKSVTVLPLRKPRPADAEQSSAAAANAEIENTDPLEVIGALIIEQIESDLPREVISPRVDLVYEHSSRALSNALEHSQLFLMPVWRTLGKTAWVLRARTLPKTITIASIVAIVLLGMIFIPYPYTMKATGTTQPVVKRDVFVSTEGVVYEVLVEHGSIVHTGDPLLRLRNPDLANQIADIHGKFEGTQKQIQAIERSLIEDPLSQGERTKLGGEKAQLEKQRESLEEQVKILDRKKEQLEIKAPIDGQVITWDVKKLLEQRPVTTGQVVLTVADPNEEWELELNVPERRSGKIDFAQDKIRPDLKVSYILATDPNTKHWGTVKQDDLQIMPDEAEGSVMRVRVKIDKQDLYQPRPGATVTGKVHCGYRPIGWCLFHEAYEWLQTKWFFF
jgi:multidrug efflux pump subunit AcrA (membrane-fusion protein)